jgi:hypothetical protein|tara:strand:- start:2260 stop:2580 length:321 start_codon:yes stop_codon:yes gene_type:complete
MSKVRSFSSPDDWKCLDNLLEKLPRAINPSGAIRLAVEEYAKKLDKTPYVSLDEFSTKSTVPRLDLQKKDWLELFKGMNTTELRELETKIQSKLNLVKTEVFERTL